MFFIPCLSKALDLTSETPIIGFTQFWYSMV